MKVLQSVVLGIISLYTWNYLLLQSSQKSLLFLAYVLTGFFVMCLYSGHRKSAFKNCIVLPVLLALALSAIDIASIAILSSRFLLVGLIDTALKIAFALLGGILFYIAQKTFDTHRKFLFGDLKTLPRRITSGLIDVNILLIIFGGLTLITSFIKLSQSIEGILIILVIFSYKAVQEWQSGQTFGKKIMGISVKCNPIQACARNMPFAPLFLAPYTSGILLNVIYLTILIDLIMIFTGRRLFDFISGTKVISS